MTTLRITQLHPQLLGVTGDRGNVDVLVARSRFAGHDATVMNVHSGDPLEGEPDIVVIGNGPLSALRTVRADFAGWHEALAAHVAAGGGILAVGGGAELLTHGIELLDGSSVVGLSLLPARVARTRQRHVGYIVADTPDGRLMGFEDHASEWILDSDADDDQRYGTVVAGDGSIAGADGARYESLRLGSVYATNVQGPILPLNPQLADALLEHAFARHGEAYVAGVEHERVDRYARESRAAIEKLAVSKHFTAIRL